MHDLPTETEATLVIVSDNPAQLADEIAALRRLGPYELIPRDEERLHDTYWDRPDGRLGAERVAVRLRRIGGETLVTVKGPTRRASDGVAARIELEEPWCSAAFKSLRGLLTGAGLWPVAAPVSPFVNDSDKSLQLAGFVVVQDRETLRRPRDLIAEGDPHRLRVAELAVDATIFHLDAQSVLSREIEVEAKGPGGRQAIERVTQALFGLYAGCLKRDDHSKIALGKAIATLIDELRSEHGIKSDGSLSPRGHQLLDAFLQDTDRFD